MFDEFEWDPLKRARNLKKHLVDFEDAKRVFSGPTLTKLGHSGADGERRDIAIGLLEGIAVTVVYTMRGSVCRLISARQASQNERTAYRQAFGAKPP